MNWQERLQLSPHPEGGAFRRIYTAPTAVPGSAPPRPVASAIHYLLDSEAPRGRFHRVGPTILHFLQSGGPVEYACVNAEGQLMLTTLGFGDGEALFLEVPGHTWKCSRLVGRATHALVSEVVIPAFDWADHAYLDAATLSPALRERLQREGWL